MERSVLRIIDANFNRSREGLRVIEEYCRFALNSASLSMSVKELRHQLTAAISRLGTAKLLTARDVINDVGAGKICQSQASRADMTDCFLAACKRLTEALRAISEVTKIENSTVCEAVEQIRYAAYALEKDIVLFAEPAEKFRKVQLYIIITSNLPSEILFLTQKCIDGGADCIQMRSKDTEDDKLFAIAVEFVKLCRDGGVLSIINDRVDIAVASGADGVHLGQNDIPLDCARKLQLSTMIIGKSTHSIEQLKAACRERPTYVGLGPVFATPTKPTAPAVGLEYVTQAQPILDAEGIGHAAIGGITLDNVQTVLDAGAKCISVCSAVTHSKDPAATCRALKSIITKYLANNRTT